MNSDQITKYIDKAFEQSVIKNFNFEKTYKLKDPILFKHFIINAIGEFNNKFALENKNFGVDFDEDTKEYFIKIDYDYLEKTRMYF